MSEPGRTEFVTRVARCCQYLDQIRQWFSCVMIMKVVTASPGRFVVHDFGEKHHRRALAQAPEGICKSEVSEK